MNISFESEFTFISHLPMEYLHEFAFKNIDKHF